LFQNPVGFEQAPGKTGQNPGFSVKSKEAVPKTEVLEQPQLKTFLVQMYHSSELAACKGFFRPPEKCCCFYFYTIQ
jgi:hypothetical protein